MNERANPNEEVGREHVGKYTDAEGPEPETEPTQTASASGDEGDSSDGV